MVYILGERDVQILLRQNTCSQLISYLNGAWSFLFLLFHFRSSKWCGRHSNTKEAFPKPFHKVTFQAGLFCLVAAGLTAYNLELWVLQQPSFQNLSCYSTSSLTAVWSVMCFMRYGSAYSCCLCLRNEVFWDLCYLDIVDASYEALTSTSSGLWCNPLCPRSVLLVGKRIFFFFFKKSILLCAPLSFDASFRHFTMLNAWIFLESWNSHNFFTIVMELTIFEYFCSGK